MPSGSPAQLDIPAGDAAGAPGAGGPCAPIVGSRAPGTSAANPQAPACATPRLGARPHATPAAPSAGRRRVRLNPARGRACMQSGGRPVACRHAAILPPAVSAAAPGPGLVGGMRVVAAAAAEGCEPGARRCRRHAAGARRGGLAARRAGGPCQRGTAHLQPLRRAHGFSGMAHPGLARRVSVASTTACTTSCSSPTAPTRPPAAAG